MPGSDRHPWRRVDSGLLLRVRLTPKSSRDAIDGIEATGEGPALKARVRAVPENNAANVALERLVADWLGLPKRSVALVQGGKSRVKTLSLVGAGEEVEQTLRQRLAPAGT